MPILNSIRKEGFGAWATVVEFLNDAYRRDAGALAGMAAALSAPPAEQKELGEAGGLPVLLSIACDLRLPKGARLGATRCALECSPSPEELAQLFTGAGDLTTDPRLGSAAKRLVELGLPPALKAGTDQSRVSIDAVGFTRAAHAAASVSGKERVKELLALSPPAHAGAAAALFALGLAELPAGDTIAWKKLLSETCAANKRAPAAAKRMGLAPPWPPYLPEAFAPLVAEAEKANQEVVSLDAVAAPPPPRSGPGKLVAAPPLASQPRQASPPEGGAKTAPVIRRATASRRPGHLEAPSVMPARAMPPVAGRGSPREKAPGPERPHLSKSEGEATSSAQVPGVQQARAAPSFDKRGARIPRADRWSDDAFEWELPILPESSLRPPMTAAVVQGPFAARLNSLFQDRPEAIDRLSAAAEARAALRGESEALAELERELSRPRWSKEPLPLSQLTRLRAAASAQGQPSSWKRIAELLLARLAPREHR